MRTRPQAHVARLLGAPPRHVNIVLVDGARQATENRFARFVWPAGEALAAWVWEAGPAALAGRTVIELGAGLALPSFAACACRAAEVLATDAAYTADADLGARMGAMLAQNDVQHQMRFQALPWENLAAVEALQEAGGAVSCPDLLLAADVLYNQQGSPARPRPASIPRASTAGGPVLTLCAMLLRRGRFLRHRRAATPPQRPPLPAHPGVSYPLVSTASWRRWREIGAKGWGSAL